ncbi:helix-turn-helix domain-containing protein [Mucilaginibacter sp. X5P1]|uniref:helix-turn-helix domain-containing protein n=1 Tax=Mucilaginibacter sp. X5P1 TaxID=2723088 RepID=UPI0016135887|nr:helix-turn-helix domain-containing protein [Mucilaginibacter sp. X5P1]MBB6139346.1 transcriptional regulator with XRE-family HTH domain [Mucilaginibacter sp. X5P1]
MYNNATIAVNIKNARLEKNYSQEYVAGKLKLSQNAYSKIELGHTKITVERLSVIADVLEIGLARLIDVNIWSDINAINEIPITGMSFAAIARVTKDRWIAYSVLDEINFGILPGSELKLETTICYEIMHHQKAVVIDEVATDEVYAHHPTPAMYGFQSYISMPIFRQNGSFFGTLCAIDPRPAKINTPATIMTFKLFAELISFHLSAIEKGDFKPTATLSS